MMLIQLICCGSVSVIVHAPSSGSTLTIILCSKNNEGIAYLHKLQPFNLINYFIESCNCIIRYFTLLIGLMENDHRLILLLNMLSIILKSI